MNHELIKEWTGDIEIKELQINERDWTPKQNGLNDLRMGVNTNERQSIVKDILEELNQINLYIMRIFADTKKVLKCICHNCGKLRQPQSEESLVYIYFKKQNNNFQRAKQHNLNRKRLNEIVNLLGRIEKCEVNKQKQEDNQVNEEFCGEKIQALNGQFKIQYNSKEAQKELTAERFRNIKRKQLKNIQKVKELI